MFGISNALLLSAVAALLWLLRTKDECMHKVCCLLQHIGVDCLWRGLDLHLRFAKGG